MVQIKRAAAMSRTDLNKAAETILIPLLNEVYGWNLENINYAENDNNYPGIDLADEAAGISIQVTATPDLKKIKHTLEQFTKHNQYLKYKRLIIYILKEKQNSYSKTAIQGIVQNKFSFDSQKDIWDDRNILKEVSNFPIDRALRVQEILEAYFGEDQKPPSLFANRSEQKIDWQETCRGMLDRQIQFPTLNDLMAKDGVCIDPTLFVPVGLVERKQKQYRRSDVDSAEYGSQLLQPTEEEIVKRFDNEEDFFSQIICNSDISNHSRLVITGEPGAGKTTLLQKIGDRLCQAGMFPIWFSLGKSGVLPTYEFLSRVLKENAQPRNFESSNWEASISALLQTGKVWLLLDGADEFTTNGNPLHVIGAQLREAWANQVRIVLTCRLNAWDTYALPEFKVFRTLEFDYRTPVDGYSNQVEAYIYRFFAKDGVDPQLGNALIQQLHLPGKERIRDSVKNPLRLSLLCYIWESGIGELPDTRAELYRIFVEYYYDLQELKHPEISIDSTERDTLNLALGEVAKAALDSYDSRFRLRKSLIETIPTMGKESTKDSLFDKAVRLGWLNRIGTTAEKPYEAAYAFFHTTFQEYFAALAIDDWDYFLPHDHNNDNYEPSPGKSYRIFKAQWEEVILLWLSHPNGRVDSQIKNKFIDTLMNFEDGCGGFYSYKVFFLLAFVLSEWESIYTKQIIENLLKAAFGAFDEIGESRGVFSREAKRILRKSNLHKITEIILNIFRTTKDEKIHVRLASDLLEINPYAQDIAMAMLEHSLNNKNSYIRGYANLILGKISRLNHQEEVELSHTRKIRVFHQGQVVEVEEKNLIKRVEQLIKKSLEKHKLPIYAQMTRHELLIHDLGYILAFFNSNSLQRYLAVQALARIFYGDLDVVYSLVELFYQEENLFESIAFSLIEISTVSMLPLLVSELKPFLINLKTNDFISSIRMDYACEVLWYCAQSMSYSEFHKAWHSSSTDL